YAINIGDSTHLGIVFTDGTLDKLIPGVSVITLFGWSPDGKHLLISGSRSADGSSKNPPSNEGPLWLLDVDTLNLQPLQIPFITNWPFKAKWSPDGRFVAGVGLSSGTNFRCSDKNLPASEVDSCQYEGVSIY